MQLMLIPDWGSFPVIPVQRGHDSHDKTGTAAWFSPMFFAQAQRELDRKLGCGPEVAQELTPAAVLPEQSGLEALAQIFNMGMAQEIEDLRFERLALQYLPLMPGDNTPC